MIAKRQESVTVTLHWLAAGGEQTANIVCEDVPPEELTPLLLRGCGLAAPERDGRAGRFLLRLHAADGPTLTSRERLSAQGVRSGMHLWLLAPSGQVVPRHLLRLPGGVELLVPRGKLVLTRAWLLQALALLAPEAHRQETARIERRESPFRSVSNRPHCALVAAESGLTVGTERSDVLTLLNTTPLVPGRLAALRHGDRLTLGEGGPVLAIVQLREEL